MSIHSMKNSRGSSLQENDRLAGLNKDGVVDGRSAANGGRAIVPAVAAQVHRLVAMVTRA